MDHQRAYLADQYYLPYRGEIDLSGLQQRRQGRASFLAKPSVEVFKAPLEPLKERKGDPVNFSSDVVRFGEKDLLSDEQQEKLVTALRALIPWRKGPFSYYNQEIEAEWRSDLKWNRVLPWLPELKNKKICDVGCNNLYYMYRMLPAEPWFILGIDPMVRYYFHHQLCRKFYRDPRLNFDLLGVEDLRFFPAFFDLVLFMGVIYHRRNPIETLQVLHHALRSKGTLILESSGIKGEDPYCLFPEERYMKAPGYWFLPTAQALVNMLKRTGFQKIEVFENLKLGPQEQRRTRWAIYESLEDYLDPQDPEKTVEGYPAPYRIYIRCEKN